MTKRVFDYAKWFMNNNLDNPRNTIKGNTKLQKLLFFAQLISLAKNNEFLFEDEFSAFQNGMVIEDVRQKYKHDMMSLLNDNNLNFTDKELEVLNLTKDIYGGEDADTLSSMSHQFDYWKKYFNLSTDMFDYKDKSRAIVPNDELKKELDNINDVLYAYDIMNSDEYKQKEEYDY